MTAAPKGDIRLAALLCGVIGLYDVIYVAATLAGRHGLMYRVDVPLSDFLVFHAAARAFLEGKLGIVYDTAAFTDLQSALYGALLPGSLGFRPFLYPPTWLIGLLPFGLMPVGPAAALFLIVTGAGSVVALRTLGLGRAAILAIVTAPAAAWVVIVGQNTFLSVALFYGGFALLERRPVLAGVLLGLLAYKPQVWVLVPLALLCARAWRALLALVATVIAMALIAWLLFGSAFWLDFLAAARQATAADTAAQMYERVHLHMTTLFAAGRTLGLGEGASMALQLAGAVVSVAAVVAAFTLRPASDARLALVATATFLVSPYTLNYDLLLLMPAVVLLFLHPPATGYRAGERVTYLALWLAPHFCMLLNEAGLPLMPLILATFGWFAWQRLGALKPH
jgi:hypothetical protein